MSSLDRALEETRRWGYSAAGFAERYDRYRPRPPAILSDFLSLLAGVRRPGLVVDLGSGTGLSTRYWADHADDVVGIEPNPEMRAVAEAATEASNVSYRAAAADDSGLDDGCADIVTCSQSLQWMEPAPAFAEVGRILRPGGVFAAYEYRWTVTTSPAANAAFEAAFERKGRLLEEMGMNMGRTRWPVTHERFVDSGVFSAVDETVLHSIETLDAERLVGFMLSEGSTSTLLTAGVSEGQIGIDLLREAATAGLGDEPSPWFVGYRVVLGWA